MIHLRIGFVLALFLLPLGVSAQDKFTIKTRKDAKGDVSNITREEKAEEMVRVVGPNGMEIQKKSQTTILTTLFREEILEKAAGLRATKLTRTYEKAEVRIGDQVNPFAYQGKKVLIEKSGEVVSFTVDGKALEGKDLGTLPRDFDPKRPSEDESDKLFLPNKAVAEGETWPINAKDVLSTMLSKDQAAKTYDLSKAKASGKLAKAYKKEGVQYGIIEYELSAPLKEFAGRFPCKDGAMFTLKITGDLCIDGSTSDGKSTMVTSMRGKSDITKDDKPTGAVLEFDVTSTVTGSGTPAKK